MPDRLTFIRKAILLIVSRVLFICVTALISAAAAQAATAPETILQDVCSGCHLSDENGRYARLSDIRKTPEGWQMTLTRMAVWHGVKITPKQSDVLIKFLSDTQGLAPVETRDDRYALERRPNIIEPIETKDVHLFEMCARCHSSARFALQRRNATEWRKLAHTHLGQFITLEYHDKAYDKDWWELAQNEIPAQLGGLYPLDTTAWRNWKAHAKATPSGEWRITGERPGTGRYEGVATITGAGQDLYDIRYTLTYADGRQVNGQGHAQLYTGYEWRGMTRLGAEDINEVYALSEDGNQLQGRWFLENADEIGADIVAVRKQPGVTKILAVEPPYLPVGALSEIAVHGIGLSDIPSFPKDISVVKVLARSGDTLRLRIRVARHATIGRQEIAAKNSETIGQVVLYNKIDSLVIEPSYAIARLGGGIPAPISAQFNAVGYLNGPDGLPGTADDIRLGSFPAKWSIGNYNKVAEEERDSDFAGAIQADGLFIPASFEANPKRRYQGTNFGNLSVTAFVDDRGHAIKASAHLIVSTPRWNNPPIR